VGHLGFVENLVSDLFRSALGQDREQVGLLTYHRDRVQGIANSLPLPFPSPLPNFLFSFNLIFLYRVLSLEQKEGASS